MILSASHNTTHIHAKYFVSPSILYIYVINSQCFEEFVKFQTNIISYYIPAYYYLNMAGSRLYKSREIYKIMKIKKSSSLQPRTE